MYDLSESGISGICIALCTSSTTTIPVIVVVDPRGYHMGSAYAWDDREHEDIRSPHASSSESTSQGGLPA